MVGVKMFSNAETSSQLINQLGNRKLNDNFDNGLSNLCKKKNLPNISLFLVFQCEVLLLFLFLLFDTFVN